MLFRSQVQLGLAELAATGARLTVEAALARVRPQPLKPRVSEAEREAHRNFVATLGAQAIWRDYAAPDSAGDKR